MSEEVILDITTVEETVTIDTTDPEVIEINVVAPEGPAGPAGPNTITSTTTSDGTGNISLNTLEVLGTLTASHIHGNLAGSVYAHVRAGENLAKGDPVYVSGSHGSGSTLIAIVSKADASNASKMPAVGVMDAAVTANANGHMVITGTISDVNTAAYAINAELYVANGGGLTATPPAASSQPVGRVERSNTNNGAFIVKVNGWASSGGNGVSDANKLVRFGSSGTIPISSVTGSRSGIDSRTSFPNDDVTAATDISIANTLVRRGEYGEAAFGSNGTSFSGTGVFSVSDSGVGVAAYSGMGTGINSYSADGTGAEISSSTGTGLIANSEDGTNHSEFGNAGNDRSFIRRILGLIGWHRGSFTQTLGSPATLTANRAVTLPDADGALIIQGGALGTPSSGTLTNCSGLPISTGVAGLGSGVATFLATPTSDNLAAALTDETGTSGGFVRAGEPTITSPSLAGSAQFTGTARPTSAATGSPAATSLITRNDNELEQFYTLPRIRRMTAPNSLASSGTAPTVSISSGIVANFGTFVLSSSGGARLIEHPSAITTLPAFNQPTRSVVYGRFVPATTAGSGVARIVHKVSSGSPALAGATDVIAQAGWGVEFYAAGGSYRARLFLRASAGVSTIYSGSGTGAGTVSFTAAADSYVGVMLVNDGAGNFYLHLLSGQTAGTAQGRIPETPTLSWLGAISGSDLNSTYNPSLLVEIANAASGTAGVAGCVTSAISTL